VRSELRDRGRPIPVNDVWIAALARQHTLPILSRDTHFDEVAGIQRIGW
jgi:predicted nucleic acid-binding protein